MVYYLSVLLHKMIFGKSMYNTWLRFKQLPVDI